VRRASVACLLAGTLLVSGVCGGAWASLPSKSASGAVKGGKAGRDFRPAIREAVEDFRSNRLADGLTKLDAVLAKKPPASIVAIAQAMRAGALASLGRRDDAMTALKLIEVNDPASPAVVQLAVMIAPALGEPEFAAEVLIRRGDALKEGVLKLDAQPIRRLFAQLRKKQRTDLTEAVVLVLARIGYADGEIAQRDHLQKDAVGILLKRGDANEAAQIAAGITSRPAIAAMLSNRRYELVWTALETRAGPHMALSDAAAVSEAKVALDARPGDVKVRKSYVSTLYQAGRLEEADAAAASFAATPEDMAKIDEDGGWLINEHALVLDGLGKKRERDGRYAAMTALDLPQHGWLISMIINRAEYVVNDRDLKKALPLIDDAGLAAEKYGSAYARQLVRRLKVCALNGLHKKADLKAAVEDLVAHVADSKSTTIDGLLCVSNFDDAAKLAIELLVDEKEASDIIRNFQPDQTGWLQDPSLWSAPYARLLQRPDVRAAFDKVGRILPESMWPEKAVAKAQQR
jgi:tellurite resistance protein